MTMTRYKRGLICSAVLGCVAALGAIASWSWGNLADMAANSIVALAAVGIVARSLRLLIYPSSHDHSRLAANRSPYRPT